MNVHVSPSAAHAVNRAECLALLSWTRSPAHAHCQTSSSDVMFGGASKINGEELQLENLHFSDMKLTRKLVLARAKASDLESVKKLNCWGCNLTDISIFLEMPNIEVLTLSANKISCLEHISSCQHLTELYLRRNNIESLSELKHLKNLIRLKVLWLAENPCCGSDPTQYRLTVLRNLPGLHKLDNQAVTEEELILAFKEGEELVTPPGSAPLNSSNGLTEADSETDPLNYSMEETNKIRAQLGMKLLPRDKFPSLSSPRESGETWKRKSHTLEAVLLLLKDLDIDELKVVQSVAESKLRSRGRQRERQKSPICT